MSDGEKPRKRALILAGGGMKVAFQAGVLQVWLDEAGLVFDYADGASGGTFNLAMWCQGMTGTEIADNWRTLPASLGIDFNWSEYAKLPFAESLMTLDRFRDNVFRHWGLDWAAIRASDREASFNVYNFSRHELEVLPPERMTPEFLVACVSLPMWFPPAHINGDVYIDPVYITDANLEEAIARGADELWVIWTVSERGEWNDGFVANYFQIIETAANGHFKRLLHRIEASNDAITRGENGEFGRKVEVKLLKAEVPLHYIINLSGPRVKEAVNRGVATARAWCVERGIPVAGRPDATPADPTSLEFTETMKGYVGLGSTDPHDGYQRGRAERHYLMVRLTIRLDGVHRFVADPAHEATATGTILWDALGDTFAVERGVFNLFVDEGDPAVKQMLYRLFFRDRDGHELTLSGGKRVEDDPGADLWDDTSTLYTRVLRGHVGAAEEGMAEVVGAGIVRIQQLDFARQLTSFRVEGPSARDRAGALGTFGVAFLGKLWDVYARRVLSSGPF